MGNKKSSNSGIRVFSPPKKRTKAGKAAGIILTVLSVAVFWIGLWLLLALKINSELLLPSPVTVFKRLFELSGTSDLWRSAGSTILRILAGYAAGILAGTILAALSAWSKHMAALLAPPGRIIKATPVASFIILALVWIPANNIPSFIVFLLVTPIVWDALKTALISTDPDLLEMAKVYRFGRLKTVLNVYIPSSMSAYLSSILTALGLAWKAGIAAEVLCLPKLSIGRRLYESKIYLEMPDLFAWTMLVVILSVVMEALIRLAVRRVTGAGKNKAADNAEADGKEAAAETDGAAAGHEAQTAAAVTERAAEAENNPEAAAETDGAAAGYEAQTAAAVTERAAETEEAALRGNASARPIEISDLYKSYGSNIIFSGLSASIPDGVTCLTGPSGSGKTTLARILAGLEGAEGGCIRSSGGEPVFLFQDPRLLPWKSALDNVALAASNSSRKRLPPAEARALSESFLAALGLGPADILKRPGQLSGGMRQRVAIARAALAARSIDASGSFVSLTVLDEPLKGLDPATRSAAVRFIKETLCRSGGPVIIITHNSDDLADFPGYILTI